MITSVLKPTYWSNFVIKDTKKQKLLVVLDFLFNENEKLAQGFCAYLNVYRTVFLEMNLSRF